MYCHLIEVAQDVLDGILQMKHPSLQMMEIGLSFDQLLGGEVDVPIGQTL
jgi:hypothetical protein